jgi:hypothetical protein
MQIAMLQCLAVVNTHTHISTLSIQPNYSCHPLPNYSRCFKKTTPLQWTKEVLGHMYILFVHHHSETHHYSLGQFQVIRAHQGTSSFMLPGTVKSRIQSHLLPCLTDEQISRFDPAR